MIVFACLRSFRYLNPEANLGDALLISSVDWIILVFINFFIVKKGVIDHYVQGR